MSPLDQPGSGLTIAQIGVGRWGRHILRDLVALGCEVHAVARSPESIAHAKEFGASSIVSDPADLPQTDAAVVASLASTHAESIDAVAERTAGPIYCEKPLTADLPSAERLVGAFSDRLFVMDKWRYHAGILELARIASSGEIGEIQSIQSRRVSTRNPHEDVGTLWTHVPHDLAVAYEILGEFPQPRFAVGEYVNGRMIGIQATLGGPPWISIEVSDAAPDHRRETRVIGATGSAVLDGGWAEHVAIRRHDGSEDEIIETPGELPLLAELRAFVEHVAGGPPPKSSAEEALAQVRIIAELLAMAEGNERAGVAEVAG